MPNTRPFYASKYSDNRARNSVPSTAMRQVTNRVRLCALGSAGFTSGLGRQWHISYVPISKIQLVFANWYINTSTGAETGPGAATTVGFWVEYPKGTYTQITWSGSATAAVPSGTNGATDIFTLPFTIPPFTRFWIWTYAANATMMVYQSYINTIDYQGGDAFQFNASLPNPLTGSISDNSSGINTICPSLVLAPSNRQVWATIGDSLTEGVDDSLFDGSGGQGLFGRALAQFAPQVNLGVGGDRMAWFNASHTLRSALVALAGTTHIINSYGVNDFYSGSTSAATLATARETLRGLFTQPVYDCTVCPFTSSTDGWATLANQTIQNSTQNTQRTTYNSAVRAGISTSPGIIDWVRLMETTQTGNGNPVLNGGYWIPAYVDANGSGIHPSSVGYEKISALVSSFLNTVGA